MAYSEIYDQDTGFLRIGRLISPMAIAVIAFAFLVYGMGVDARIAMIIGLGLGAAEFFAFTTLMNTLERFRK